MMFPSNRVRILISTKPVDFRKGHDGLAALVSSQLRVNERSKLTRSQHLNLTRPLYRKAPRRAALI